MSRGVAIVSAALAGGAVLGAARLHSATRAEADLAAAAVIAGVPSGAVCRTPVAPGADPRARVLLAQSTVETRPLPRIPEVGAPGGSAEDDPPLWGNLGRLTLRITTAAPRAQRYFDQGLRLAYAFNHGEAGRAFRKAQRLDPGCAMCAWGEALVLGPNINAPMDAKDVPAALAAVTRALALAPKATERERGLIEALAQRYSPDPGAPRAPLDLAYAEAMGRLAARFPDDPDIGVLYAEALMDLSPWDYWEPGGAKPRDRAADIVPTLERVLAAHPAHPGAIHLYIHAVEASNAAQRALPHARRLAALMPGAGHLVHMPSHVYYRLGLYRDSLAANRAAMRADEAYFRQANASPIYRFGYYPHNVHFLLVSAQMAGDGRSMIEAAGKLDRVLSDEALDASPLVQPVKVAPYFAHAQFSAPSTILALRDPGDARPYIKAMWRYARGVAYAANGELAAASAEAAAIGELEAKGDFADLTEGGIPAREVLQIARLVVEARVARAAGRVAEAIERFEAAVLVEEQLAYMEPPYWYYPVRQSLGAALVQAGRLDEAEKAFREALARAPNNGWALYGLSEVHRARGDRAAHAATLELLRAAWVGDRKMLTLARL